MQKSIQSVEKEESIETISFYHKNQLIILKIDNIKVLEVEGNYTRLTGSNNQTYLLRKSLKKWEQELTQSFFTKVHRSCIINKKYIEKVYVGSNYQLQIQLKDMNEVIEVSKRFTPLLKKHLTTFRS
jgi:two-component system LytT family response regulator